MSRGGGIPAEALLDLRRRIDELSPRHRGRRVLVEGTAELFGVSRATVYRALAGQLRPRGQRRADRGEPRKIPRTELERYCELVAALKLRTSNLKGRRLSTSRCISLLEEYGVETPDGLVRAPRGVLHKATANRHPKLRNDLRRPTMEEIGHRTDVLAFEGLGEDTRAYLDWLLGECAEDGVDTLIEPAALDLMAMRLNTPLQFAEHLNRAFEAGFRMGQKPITADIVAATLSPDFDDLEPRLTRQGYSVKVLAEQFHARPTEIRRFLNGQLDAGRTRELADHMRAVGLAL